MAFSLNIKGLAKGKGPADETVADGSAPDTPDTAVEKS